MTDKEIIVILEKFVGENGIDWTDRFIPFCNGCNVSPQSYGEPILHKDGCIVVKCENKEFSCGNNKGE